MQRQPRKWSKGDIFSYKSQVSDWDIVCIITDVQRHRYEYKILKANNTIFHFTYSSFEENSSLCTKSRFLGNTKLVKLLYE